MKILPFILLIFNLNVVAQEPHLVLPIGHRSYVNTAQFSPNNKWILTASMDGTCKLWDARSGNLIETIVTEPNDNITCAQFSPDSKRICIVGNNTTIFEIGSNTITKLFNGRLTTSANFSNDGNKIVFAFKDSTAKIFDVKLNKFQLSLRGHTGIVHSAEFSHDGKEIITSSNDSTIKIWNSNTGVLLKSIFHRAIVGLAKFSYDGRKIVSVSTDCDISVWDSNSGARIKAIYFDNCILCFDISPDGTKVVGTLLNGGIIIWNLETGNIVTAFSGHKKYTWDVHFSYDGRKIVTASKDSTAAIWDVSSGKNLFILRGSVCFATSTCISKGRNIALTTAVDNNVKLWDIKDGKLIRNFKAHSKMIISSDFNPDENSFATASEDKLAKIWDVKSGNLLFVLNNHEKGINCIRYSNDGFKIVTSSSDGVAKIWDTKNGRLIRNLIGHNAEINWGEFSPNNDKIATASLDSTAKIWNAKSGALLLNLKGHKHYVTSAKFHPNGKSLLTTSWDHTVKLWDSESGMLLHTFGDSVNLVVGADFSQDGKFIILSLWQKERSIYRLNDFSKNEENPCVFTIENKSYARIDINSVTFNFTSDLYYLYFNLIPIDTIDYVFFTPFKYYKSTQKAARLLHYVTDSLEVITFDQLDIKYNRPDLVLKAMGNEDIALINAYHNAYLKRIKKLGIDTTLFKDDYTIPNGDFENRNNIEYDYTDSALVLRYIAKDNIYKLDRFNLWINESPIYGSKGISLKEFNKKSFDTTLTVSLSPGKNKIEASVFNANATESYRIPLYVNYNTPNSIGKTYFIGIGIDHFKSDTNPLTFCVKDIKDIAAKYNSHGAIILDTLFNKNVTISSVKLLKKKLRTLTEKDNLIISYSGHGLLSDSLDYYLSTWDVDFKKPQNGGLPYDALEGLFDSIRPRNKLLLIDACHSGEIDKDAYTKGNNSTLPTPVGKGGDLVEIDSKLGLTNSFDLMQSLFVNVSRNTGAIVISASQGKETAGEDHTIKNGYFTSAVLEAFDNNNSLTASQLMQYVSKRVVELSHGKQKPTFRAETQENDWRVW